jgi:nucleoid-associated protein YgaU
MGRYNNNKTKKLTDGRVVYTSKILPSVPKSDDDLYIVVQEGDRLDSIAQQYLDDASLWWVIATANQIHDAPFSLADGTILRIPANVQGYVGQVERS